MAKGSGASGRSPGRPRKIPAQPTEFGRLVKELRRGRGYSQEELARSAGISTGYLGMLESGLRGESPSPRLIFGLADALNATRRETLGLVKAMGRDAAQAAALIRARPKAETLSAPPGDSRGEDPGRESEREAAQGATQGPRPSKAGTPARSGSRTQRAASSCPPAPVPNAADILNRLATVLGVEVADLAGIVPDEPDVSGSAATEGKAQATWTGVRSTLQTSDLVSVVAARTGEPVTTVQAIISTLLEVVTEALVSGSSVMFRRFGRFSVRRYKAMERTNPLTGGRYLIGPRYSVSFAPSDVLKARLNPPPPGTGRHRKK